MTALARVHRMRALLLGALILSSALWGWVLFFGVVAAGLGSDALFELGLALRRLIVPLGLVAAGVMFLLRLYRGRGASDPARVALYFEERTPELGFALITAVRPAGRVDPGMLEERIGEHFSFRVARPDLVRALGIPLLLVALLLVPPGMAGRAALSRIIRPEPGDLLALPASQAGEFDRLERIVVRLAPPKYTGAPASTLENPLSVEAIEGSRVTVLGRGGSRSGQPPILAGPLASGPTRVSADTWSVAFTMPAEPQVLRFTDGARARLLGLEPVTDQAPAVTLILPAGDTTYATGRGRLSLEARATDDLGLGRVWFELLLTSGSGERFTTRTWMAGTLRPAGARDAVDPVPLALDSLRLGPGDVLNIRALAEDLNDVGGPSVGTSDTRTLRIADPDQGEGVKIVPAAAATLDTTVLSQRMLIIRAETLLVRRKRMGPDSFRVQAIRLGERQQMLRDRVQALILELETATDVGFIEETPESRVLRRASIAMRNAAAQLALAGVSQALPEMYRALRALDEGRTARRIYLRGILQRVVVDLDQVRLKGKNPGTVGPRAPRARLADRRAALLLRLDRLLGPGASAPGRLDSLLVLRSEALRAVPEAAVSVADALAELRAGRDPRPALIRFRRALLPAIEPRASLPAWAGIP